MAGHSKWKNIRHRKGVQDARKAKIFTKIIRELTIAARGGGVPADNPRLRSAVDKALSVNMTRETIDKAIARGVGKNGEDNLLEEIVYEGYGVGGTAFYVEAMTDNRNRTAGEVRHAFTKCGGNLGTSGSVSYLFKKKGMIYFEYEHKKFDEVSLLEKAIELGAVDVEEREGGVVVETLPEYQAFNQIKQGMAHAGFICSHSEISMVPDNYIAISDPDSVEKVMKLIEILEDLDDIQNVYSNADIEDAVIE